MSFGSAMVGSIICWFFYAVSLCWSRFMSLYGAKDGDVEEDCRGDDKVQTAEASPEGTRNGMPNSEID